MSFSATFSNSLSGLSAASFRAELVSFNIANANTENFARRTVSFESVVPGGVRIGSVGAADAGRQEFRLIGAETEAAGTQVRADALKSINEAYGQPGDTGGLYAVYARFEEALADLRLTPESGAAQLAYLRASHDVAETFAKLDGTAQAMRLEADGAINRTVVRLNGALVELQALNAQAVRPNAGQLDAVAEKQRALVAEIGRAMDINVQGKFGEALTIRTGGGALLLGETAREISFAPAGSASFELTLTNGDFSGLSVDGQDITPGSLQGVRGGSLAGQFAVRDVLAQDFAGRLDAAATELATRAALAEPSGLDGLFVIEAGVSSAAQRLAVNPLVDPAQGGELYRLRDGTGAIAAGPSAGDGILGDWQSILEDVRPLSTATGTPQPVSFRDALGGVATVQATAALRAEGLEATAANTLETLSSDVARQIGVDTDRELQDLLLIEQAFAANARVIQVADNMLSTLLEI